MNKWLEYCIRKAQDRNTEMPYRLHAVVVRGGSVQTEGHNQSAESSDMRVVHPSAPSWMGIHAEIDCVRRSLPSHLKGATLYVGGVNRSSALITTCPCDFCAKTIKDTKISNVFYHTDTGEEAKLLI